MFQQYFRPRAKFKYFRYFANGLSEENIYRKMPKKYFDTIVVNHSASRSGNHLTVLEKLQQIDVNHSLKKIIVPLSYGSEVVRQAVISYSQSAFPKSFFPITNTLSRKEYFSLIDQATVAIYGHRRQEGAGNIFHLLANGTKIFLRKDNNMLKYLRTKGYSVFEYETELATINDLAPLTKADQQKNRELALAEYSKEQIDSVFKNLFES